MVISVPPFFFLLSVIENLGFIRKTNGTIFIVPRVTYVLYSLISPLSCFSITFDILLVPAWRSLSPTDSGIKEDKVNLIVEAKSSLEKLTNMNNWSWKAVNSDLRTEMYEERNK